MHAQWGEGWKDAPKLAKSAGDAPSQLILYKFFWPLVQNKVTETDEKTPTGRGFEGHFLINAWQVLSPSPSSSDATVYHVNLLKANIF